MHTKHIKILLAVSITVFVIAASAFCITAYIVALHSHLKFDDTIFKWLQPIHSVPMTHIMIAITFVGSKYFLFPCYSTLVIYYLFIRKKLWFAVALALTGFAGNQLLFLMQDVFKRVRPANPLINYVNGYGYPSGHSFASFVFAGLLSYLIWQKPLHTKWKLAYTIVLVLIASIIAMSRIYLHVHYPTDVLGGFYLSIVWLMPCLWTLSYIEKMHADQLNG